MEREKKQTKTPTTATNNQNTFPTARPIPNFSKPLLTAANIPVPKFEVLYTLTDDAKQERDWQFEGERYTRELRREQLENLFRGDKWFKNTRATRMQKKWQEEDAKRTDKYTFSADVISSADYEGYKGLKVHPKKWYDIFKSNKKIVIEGIHNRYEQNAAASKQMLEQKIKTYYNHFIAEDQQAEDSASCENINYIHNDTTVWFIKSLSYNKLTPTICYPAELKRRREVLAQKHKQMLRVYVHAFKNNQNSLTDDAQDAYMQILREFLKLADLAQALKKQLDGSKQGIIDQWTAACKAAAPEIPQTRELDLGSLSSNGGAGEKDSSSESDFSFSFDDSSTTSDSKSDKKSEVEFEVDDDWIEELYNTAQKSLDDELDQIGKIFLDAGILTDEKKEKYTEKLKKLGTKYQEITDERKKIDTIVTSINVFQSKAPDMLKKDVNLKVYILKILKKAEKREGEILKEKEKKLSKKKSENSSGENLEGFAAAASGVLNAKESVEEREYNECEEKVQRIVTIINYMSNPTAQNVEPAILWEGCKFLLGIIGWYCNIEFNAKEKKITDIVKKYPVENLSEAGVATGLARKRLEKLETQAENKRKYEYIAAHKDEYEKLLVDDKFLAFIILVAQLQKQARSVIPAQKSAAGQSSQELLKQQQAELLNRMLSQESLRQMTTMFNDMTKQAQMNAATIPEGLAPDQALETLNMNLKVNDVMAAFTQAFSAGIGLYNPAMAFAAKKLITVKHNRQERLKQYASLGIKKHWAISKHLHGLDPVEAFRSLGAGFGLVESTANQVTSAVKSSGIFGAEQIILILSLIPGINAITGGFNAIAQGIAWHRSYKKMKEADKEIIIRLDRIKEREKNNKNSAVRLLIDGKETKDKKEKKANPSIDELKKRIGETETDGAKKEKSILKKRVKEFKSNEADLRSASVKDLNEILSFYNLRQIHNTNRHASKFGTISSVSGALAGGMQAALAVSSFLNPATVLPAILLGPVSVGLSVANSFVQQNAIHKMNQLSKKSAKLEADLSSAVKDIAALKPLSELKDENSEALNLDAIAERLTVDEVSNKLNSLKSDDKNRLFREYVPVYRKLDLIPGADIIALAANTRPKKNEGK